MAGKVQMVYFDPPYGISYGSNFQPFVNKRDVKDGKDEDLTARAGADPRLPRHLGTGHPLLPDLPARPPAAGARAADRDRAASSCRSATRTFISSGQCLTTFSGRRTSLR
ncbi:MAG: hypothetical protein MZV70_46805 [Desulfobacterales bacterium]|nr:hypothetical protein [Desulfobacterales bacterium]